MNGFYKRYFLLISLAFLGFLVFTLNNNPLILWAAFAVLLALIVVVCRKFKIKRKNLNTIIILLLIASVIGIGRAEIYKNENNALLEKYVGYHSITGYVKDISSTYPYMSESVVCVESIDSTNVSFEAVLYTEFPSEMSAGDGFECFVEILPLSTYENKDFLRNGDKNDYTFVLVAESEDEFCINGNTKKVNTIFTQLNSKLSATLKVTLGESNGSLASALLLGNRDLLDNSTLRDFKRAGVYHMLALSGLHVAILVGLLDFILKKTGVHSHIRIAVLVLSTLFYVALTGFSLSACRAMMMLFMVYLSNILRARNDAMTSLFVAASIICFISPMSIFDLGFQLSFLSTFGVICSSIICKKIKFLSRVKKKDKLRLFVVSLLKLFVLSICVFVFTLPLIMKYFGEVSLATFVSNLFMGFICEAFMVFSILALIFGGGVFVYPAAILGNTMLALAKAISSIDGVMLSLAYPNIEYIVWGLFIISIVLFVLNLKRKWIIAVPSVAFVLLLVVNISIFNISREGSIVVEYLQNDIIVVSSNDEVYICDVSNGRYGNLYDGLKLAKEGTFTEIDGVILTHYHSYHAMSINRLADTCILHSVYLPKPISEKETMVMASIFDALKNTSTKLYMYESNTPLDIMGGELIVSNRAYSSDYSHPSVALTYSYGDSRVTLIENPYFDSYLEESGMFDSYISTSDLVIFGSDGRAPENRYEVFDNIKFGAEIVFADRESMLLSDFEFYIDDFDIYVDVLYKKYELK